MTADFQRNSVNNSTLIRNFTFRGITELNIFLDFVQHFLFEILFY